MPPPASRSPRFKRSPRRRSRSSSPRRPPAQPRNVTGASHLTYLTPPARTNHLSSRHSLRRGTPEQGLSAVATTSRGISTCPPDRTGRFPAENEGWLSNPSGGLASVPQSAIPTRVVDSNSLEMLGLAVQQFTHPTYPSHVAGLVHPRQPLLPQHSQQSSNPERLDTCTAQSRHFPGLNPNLRLRVEPGQHITNFPQPQRRSSGIFSQAHDFTITRPTFIDGNVTYNNSTSSQFMEKLLEKTIPGAAFDSSARDPPPRCHPGTRLAILERCLDFIPNCDGAKKMRWVVGAAGVGKSAIMQNVAESPNLPVVSQASVFFSVVGRNEGSKTVITISYQIATRSEVYRRLIENEIACDPSLLESAMAVQFKKLIAEPFAHHPHLHSAGRVLIIIDGLDECNSPYTQQELLRLISDFCITYPSSPIVWLIASRPEPHITSFFSRRNVMPVYEKEEITVDSDEARTDVERYLRDELTEIKEASDSLDPNWPGEPNLWRLAHAAGGLFAYAHTVIRYISDSSIGSPASQFSDVLNVIDRHPMIDVTREEHPLALLDALYARILSNVPSRVMINTRKFLLTLASRWDGYLWPGDSLILLCNWLHMTPEEAYAALSHLRSVLHVPKRCKAHEEGLKPFHKSFIDYIFDSTRSGFSLNIQHEFQQIKTRYTLRILKEAHGGIDFGDMGYETSYGILARGPPTGDKVSLTWPANDDNVTRLKMYKLAITDVVAGMLRGDPTFQSGFCVHLSIALFFEPRYPFFRRDQLRDLIFVESRRDEFMMQRVLKQMPLKVVHTSRVLYEVKLQFRSPDTTATNLSDPWDLSCTHIREGKWEEGKDQNWVTDFRVGGCACSYRLQCQIESLKISSPDCTVPVLFTSTEHCCVEFRFVDPEDGMSEWKYWFWYMLTWEEHNKYGNIVRRII